MILSFKISAYNETEMNKTFEEIISGHKLLKSANLGDVQCEKGVAEATCKVIPACSKDQKKIVSLLSKQECHDIVKW